MLPTRLTSVRSKNRTSAATIIPKPLRDETSTVGLRYEKTKPAQPPIPLPSLGNSLRSSSSSMTISRSSTVATIASRSTRPSSVSSSSSNSHVVAIVPHTALTSVIMPHVAPPSEQHPALRSPPPSPPEMKQAKRDTVHVATTATTKSVIHEVDGEDELDSLTPAAADMALSNEETPSREGHKTAPPEPAAAELGRLLQVAVNHEPRAAQDAPVPPPRAATPVLDNASSPQLTAKPTTLSPSSSSPLLSSPSSPRKLVKKLSVRYSAFGNKESNDAPETAPSAAMREPVQVPPMRGSVATPASSCTPQPACDQVNGQFAPLAVSIPTENLLDDDFMTGFSFSKRGSLMFGGQRATVDSPVGLPPMQSAVDQGEGAGGDGSERNGSSQNNDVGITEAGDSDDNKNAIKGEGIRQCAAADATLPSPVQQPPPDIRVLPPSVEKQSQEVRSLYETRDTINWEDGARFSFCEHLEPTPEVPAEDDSHDPNSFAPIPAGPASAGSRCTNSSPQTPDNARRETELAGGLEDWEDVDGADVDRYGFIAPSRQTATRTSTPTELKSAQFSPRRRHLLQKREALGFPSGLGGSTRAPSRKVSARSLNTVNSEMSIASVRSSRSVLRQASNLLPHHRNRRWMDEAGEILTLSPATLQDEVDEAKAAKISEQLKRKEWERSEKWRKMAKVVKHGEGGEGMEFRFDVNSPKLIERTWKGIPDRWRGVAWWSFLETAAEKHSGLPSAPEIIKAFHDLQEKSSPDDVQIDLDVPRTISSHIMFRRRYRGGQRLLFRVLHALSIYFPETGYVQGMASLAATLLCYFDEEKTFVMLVRMWQLRGLERLYRPGFEGLMTALREFEGSWLSKAMSEKLVELGIDPTAYGTRWYLTLFNLSVPFSAQLRVWDVFLLLGDSFEASTDSKHADKDGTASAATGLDVLHAAGAALIEALRELLLDSDFENAMKALTSWIPVKDENLLMKVTKAEWRIHQGKKKT